MDFLSPIYVINIVKTGLKYQFWSQIGFSNVNSVFVVKNDKNDGTLLLQITREICILLIHIHIFTQKLRGTGLKLILFVLLFVKMFKKNCRLIENTKPSSVQNWHLKKNHNRIVFSWNEIADERTLCYAL